MSEENIVTYELEGEIDPRVRRRRCVQRHLLLGQRCGREQRLEQGERAAQRGEPERDRQDDGDLQPDQPSFPAVGHRGRVGGAGRDQPGPQRALRRHTADHGIAAGPAQGQNKVQYLTTPPVVG